MKTGLVIFAHGSRIESANHAVREVAGEVARAGGYEHVIAAFLELGRPDLPGAVASLVERGIRRIVVIPYFLTLGRHADQDLPRIVEELRTAHPDTTIEVTPPLDGHPALIQIALDRAQEAFRRNG